MEYDKTIEELRQSLSLGKKNAQRLFNKLVTQPESADQLIALCQKIKSNYHLCPICFAVATEDCVFCADKSREQHRICVVANFMDLINIEQTQTYRGQYHVLMGEINLNKQLTADKLTISNLLARIDDKITEVIIATSTTFDGEVTAQLVKQMLSGYKVTVSRIAKGLPTGGSLDYADANTIIRALENRHEW